MKPKVALYLSSVCTTSSQVFLAVSVATMFTGAIDFNKLLCDSIKLITNNFMLVTSQQRRK